MVDSVSLLQQLIKCKSITPDNDGVLELVQNTLTKLGFIVEIIEFEDKNSYSVKNLYAKLGKGNNNLAFCGHLDIVPPGDLKAWEVPPFSATIKDGAIIGRGAEDMKGNIAAFIAAVASILKSFNQDSNSLIIMLTLDEESLAINGIKKLIKHIVEKKQLKIDACLLGEPTCKSYIGDCIKIGRRGSLNFVIKAKGKQGHVAYPSLFNNPTKVANKVISKLLDIDFSAKAKDFEPSNLEITGVNSSSSVYNIVPSEVEIKGNVRFNNAYTLDEVKQKITSSVNEFNNIEIDFMPDYSSPFITSNNSKLYLALQKAIVTVTNKVPQSNTFGGTSDARFIKDYTDVIEFGLLEKTLHQANEQVKIQDLEILTKIYATFLEEYFS